LKNILIVGPLLSISGYGYHSRQVFDYFLNKKDVRVYSAILPWGNTSWFVNKDAENGLIGKIIDSAVDIKNISSNEYDIGIHIQLPNEWNTTFARKNVGISAYVETDICSQSWIEKTLPMDLVIVPSNFTKQIVLNSSKDESQKKVLNDKISVVAEYYHTDFDKADKEKAEGLDISLEKVNTEFNYLSIGHLTSEDENCDRKNLIETLRYFCSQFKDDKKVGLILKTSIGRSTTLDRNKTIEVFSSIIKQIKGDSEYPKVYILHGEMSINELYSLYTHKKVNCYLTLTKGEGYGLPLLESARCGLPIIATNWSGHLDFLNNDFLRVDYDLNFLPKEKIDNNIFVDKSKWAIVRKDSVKKQLEYSYKNYEKIKEKSLKLKSEIVKNYCRKEIFNKYDKVLKEYL
jgi:glycosyltransferase involved in cell wall biosynthesis